MSRKRSLVLALALTATPAAAQEVMNASTAQKFVAGKHFSYTCFDGTEGSGRIFSDGSASGTIRPGGQGNLCEWRAHLREPERAAVPTLLQPYQDERHELRWRHLGHRLHVLRVRARRENPDRPPTRPIRGARIARQPDWRSSLIRQAGIKAE